MRAKKFFVNNVPSVAAIDFAALRTSGVSCFLFDIEGTLTPWKDETVPADIRNAIKLSGAQKVGLISNMPRNNKHRAEKVGKQIRAQIVNVPKNWKSRKPGSAMVLESLKHLSAAPEETIIIGDKLIDVLTAKNSGLAGAIWVDVMPGPDHWFDKYLYRKVEPIMKKYFIKQYPKH